MTRNSTLRSLGEEVGKKFQAVKNGLSERERARLKSAGLQKIEEFQALKASIQKIGVGNGHLTPLDKVVETASSQNQNSNHAELLLDEMMRMRVESPLSSSTSRFIPKYEDQVFQRPSPLNGTREQMSGVPASSKKNESPNAASVLDNLINMPVTLESNGGLSDIANGDLARSNGEHFSTLQQHIDRLTKENFELHRRLDMQGKVTQSLSTENQELTESYNRQAKGLEHLEKNCGLYEKEILALNATLETMTNERESCKSVIQELQERIKTLVNENVALEERNRDLRVSEVRMGKRIEESKEDKESLESKLKTMQKNAHSLEEIVRQFREENQSLKRRLQGNYAVAPIVDQAVGTTTSSTQTDHETTQWQPSSPKGSPVIKEDEKLHSPQEQKYEGNVQGADRDDYLSNNKLSITSLDFLDKFKHPMSELSSEESEILSSITALTEGIARHWQVLDADLQSRKAEIGVLRTTNHELSQKLAIQTQMLELTQMNGHSIPLPTKLKLPEGQPSDLKAHQPTELQPPPVPQGNKQLLPITGTERRGRMQSRRWFFW